MGNWTSRQRGGVEELDIHSSSAYRYPPKSGNYFGSHFIMGGEKFDSPLPDSFLFGENSDLNFLGNKPVPFPYPPPQANEPTKTLKSLVNIRRDSVHFVKAKNELEGEFVDLPPTSPSASPHHITPTPPTDHKRYNVEFTFDTDVKVAITIHYFATEEVSSTGVVYTPRDPLISSATYHYKKGAGQVFQQSSHVFQPDLYAEPDLVYSPDKDVMPVVIHCVAEEGEEPRQSHITMAVVEKHSDGQFVMKTLKQKLFVDGLCYLLQEIYGIENKNTEDVIDDEVDDTGAECVVCMSDMRDTLILPCRHLCLCNSCADSLRYQANNCPICRAPFRALLQIRALQKTGHSATHPALAGEAQPDGVPAGYELVSLVEALNGPLANMPPPLTLTQDTGAAAGEEKHKKKSRRRSSREHRNTTGSARTATSGTAPPPVEETEELEPLPPPPETPPQVDMKSVMAARLTDKEKAEVNYVDETKEKVTVSVTAAAEEPNMRRHESVTIDMDAAEESEDTLDMVEEELNNMSPKTVEVEKCDENEATTEDELLRDDPARVDDDGEDSRDELFNEDDDDDDNADVISLRSQPRVGSMPGTPRSGASIRSSQESATSATSVSSSKQLLQESTASPKIRIGKCSVSPRNDADVV